MEERSEYTYKNELRRMLETRRKNATGAEEKAVAAVNNLLPLINGGVLVYVSFGSELCTHGLINTLLKNDSDVYAPYTVNGEIIPVRLKRLGLADKLGNVSSDCFFNDEFEKYVLRRESFIPPKFCVTPFLGVNSKGYRLGYGGGCYDRYFSKYAERGICKIGFGYAAQRVEFTPETHDVPLDCCVFEDKVVYF